VLLGRRNEDAGTVDTVTGSDPFLAGFIHEDRIYRTALSELEICSLAAERGDLRDCNRNASLDQCEIAAGVTADCNDNGVPDSCEQDCNANGIADDCDLSAGASDVDVDGVPDVCQPDCNGNGSPDSHDIATGVSGDCTVDGVPDECEADCNANGLSDLCEIVAGALVDADEDGIPDECQEKPASTAVAVCGASAHYVWADEDGGLTYRSCVIGETCATEQRLVGASAQASHVAIACTEETLLVAWEDHRQDAGDIAFRRSVDGGRSFSPMRFLVRGTGAQTLPVLASSGSVALAVWEDARDGSSDVALRRSTDGGATWGALQFLVRGLWSQQVPALALDGESVFLAWVDPRHGSADIAARRSTDGGASWEPLAFLTRAPTEESRPSVSSSGASRLVAWEDVRQGSKDIALRRSSDGGASFGTVTFLARASSADTHPVLSADDADAVLAWLDRRSGNVNVSQRHSGDEGATWDPVSRLVNTPSDEQSLACSLRALRAACVWVDTSSGRPVAMARESDDGGRTWAPRRILY
jgi:hypothetical protein